MVNTVVSKLFPCAFLDLSQKLPGVKRAPSLSLPLLLLRSDRGFSWAQGLHLGTGRALGTIPAGTQEDLRAKERERGAVARIEWILPCPWIGLAVPQAGWK